VNIFAEQGNRVIEGSFIILNQNMDNNLKNLAKMILYRRITLESPEKGI